MGSAPSLTCQTKEASGRLGEATRRSPDLFDTGRTDRPKVDYNYLVIATFYLVKLEGHIAEFGHQEIDFLEQAIQITLTCFCVDRSRNPSSRYAPTILRSPAGQISDIASQRFYGPTMLNFLSC